MGSSILVMFFCSRYVNHAYHLQISLTSFHVPTICIPILQSRLEVEAEKDAMQKSDAAQEAFLAELAKDQKILGSKEVENLKQARGKSKEKRKAKDQKKLKDVKVSGGFVSCNCLE